MAMVERKTGSRTHLPHSGAIDRSGLSFLFMNTPSPFPSGGSPPPLFLAVRSVRAPMNDDNLTMGLSVRTTEI
jgi:hypothetical protein